MEVTDQQQYFFGANQETNNFLVLGKNLTPHGPTDSGPHRQKSYISSFYQ